MQNFLASIYMSVQFDYCLLISALTYVITNTIDPENDKSSCNVQIISDLSWNDRICC